MQDDKKDVQDHNRSHKAVLGLTWEQTEAFFFAYIFCYFCVKCLCAIGQLFEAQRVFIKIIDFERTTGRQISDYFLLLTGSVQTLEPRQFKNNLTMFESKLILKLLPFFTHCVGEGKRR